MLLTGCTLLQGKIDPFICDVQTAYDATGTDDANSYRVNRACLRGVNERLKACYRE